MLMGKLRDKNRDYAEIKGDKFIDVWFNSGETESREKYEYNLVYNGGEWIILSDPKRDNSFIFPAHHCTNRYEFLDETSQSESGWECTCGKEVPDNIEFMIKLSRGR
jgi:hypothetical protein